jgi:hypothetical protein
VPLLARLLRRQPRLASRLLLAARRRGLAVGFEPEGGRWGLELYVWVGLRNPTDDVFIPNRVETNTIFLLQLVWKWSTETHLAWAQTETNE